MALVRGEQITGSVASASYALTASYALSSTSVFTKNITDNLSPNTVFVNQNIFNHDNLLVESGDTLLIEQGAEYFILGELTNSGSIIVSGSLTVNKGIHNFGSISGPGVVLSNNTIVTYDVANQPYGFVQLNGNGVVSITGSLFGTASYATNALPAGLDQQIQFNSGSTLAGDASFTYVYASHSFQQGLNVIAAGEYSHAEGEGTIASGSYQHVSGKYNTHGDDTSLFIIGNGVDDANRSDIVRVTYTDVQVTGSLSVSQSIYGSLYNEAFSKNQTTTSSANIVTAHQSIFNPSNLLVQSGDLFMIEENAEYYVLGDLTNNGSIIVDGTLMVGGVLYNSGSITGIGVVL